MLQQYSGVKVVALKPARKFNTWGINRRQPEVGDVGIIVEILRNPNGDVAYLVESVNPDGSAEWLEEFAESELTTDS
jgi:hypothetical protein